MRSVLNKAMAMMTEDPLLIIPDSKGQGANMGPIWGRQDPGGPHVGPMNFSIWDSQTSTTAPLKFGNG